MRVNTPIDYVAWILLLFTGAIGPSELAGQISVGGQCAAEGPVFWGRAYAVNQVPPNISEESLAQGLSPNMRLEPIEGRISLDCEGGVLVFQQFAIAPDPVWRGAVAAIHDMTGHPRHLRFSLPDRSLTDIAIVTINRSRGQQKAISTFGTWNIWFDIDGVAAAYRELFPR